MAKSRKTIINAVSLVDLQLKLVKHPNWRILEISRLNFGFKIIFQRRAQKPPQYLSASSTQMPAIRRHRLSQIFLTHRSGSDEDRIHQFFVRSSPFVNFLLRQE